MDAFNVRDGQLFAGAAPYPAVAARIGTPASARGDCSARPHSPAPEEGDLLAVRSAGAYGFVMNSNYNTRCRAAEVLVDGSATQALRRRETRHELFPGESLLPD
jgi:diaminopimelate decarboxylase